MQKTRPSKGFEEKEKRGRKDKNKVKWGKV